MSVVMVIAYLERWVTGNEENHMLVRQGLVAYMRQHRNSVKHYVMQESEGNSLDED